ncbi:MAG: sulfite reductase subunit alpha [Chloroflexi bacterium]|nr:sulfite reductase subunit alpha [Chloroflexota bacterium]
MTPPETALSPTCLVPVLPENAPFTPEQRAYLNGFLAGLFSRAPGLVPHFAHAAAPAPALPPVTILFGTQTGNAEALAKRMAKAAGQRGFVPTVSDMAQYDRARLTQEQNLLLITSTYGDGEPPDNAKTFWEFLGSNAAPMLAKTRFSVCALGDSNYPKFCGFGKAVDARLESLGAHRVHPRADCDVEFEEAFAQWLDGALSALTAGAAPGNLPQTFTPNPAVSQGARENQPLLLGATSAARKSDNQPLPSFLPPGTMLSVGSAGGPPAPVGPSAAPAGEPPNEMAMVDLDEGTPKPAAMPRAIPAGGSPDGTGQWPVLPALNTHSLSGGADQGNGKRSAACACSRTNPFPAALVTNRLLHGRGSAKETRHFEISFAGSGLTYEAGDALGVRPTNCPALVENILAALKCSGEESVPGREGAAVALREALLGHYEITKIPTPFLRAMAERSGNETLQKLAAPNANGELTKFLWGREIIDLLLAHPAAGFAPAEFVGLLKKLQPRLYSISSSPTVHAGQVHLCVDVVRYESRGRARKGVCSTFLADRVGVGPVPVFLQPNRNFRLPADGRRPVIMVGPGTGLAPFRAFLYERQATGAPGQNWLFFGGRHAATDFLYGGELTAMRGEGTLTHLHTAFSRDQNEKIYVQHRMLENANELFEWLEAGAHFYVCGDAARMAKDVDAALRQVVERAGSRTPEQAAEYVAKLRTERRYQRDVY